MHLATCATVGEACAPHYMGLTAHRYPLIRSQPSYAFNFVSSWRTPCHSFAKIHSKFAMADPEEAQPEEPKPEPKEDKSQSYGVQDALTMEFMYYGSLLKTYSSSLSNEADKVKVTPWIKKLFRPEYQTSLLKEKRNKYLASLVICIMNDEVAGIFDLPPPKNALEDLSAVKVEPSAAAEWETDKMWYEILLALPESFVPMTCIVHETPEGCVEDVVLNRILDQEFQLFLYLVRPYAALLGPEDKTRTAAWIQALCTIHGEYCCSMKGIRNDYMMALLGYLHDLRIVGPFLDYPPAQLVTLKEAASEAAKQNAITDPTGPEANQFLMEQPVPDDGAFCYVALTGDLVAHSM